MDANLRLVEVARSFIGTKEVGNNGGEIVQRFQKAVDGKALGESWCMCFVQFCIKAVEQELGIKSPIYRSEHCLQVWNNSPLAMRRMTPSPGRVMILQRRMTIAGHAGVVTGLLPPPSRTFLTVEGNTNSGKGIEREGDGVWEKRRVPEGNNLFLVVGFLQVF